MKQLTPQNIKIGVRPNTKAKFDAIALHERRKLVEVADILASEYVARFGIAVAPFTKRRRRPSAS